MQLSIASFVKLIYAQWAMVELLLLIVLAIVLFVNISIVVAIFTPVPYVPSKKKVVQGMVDAAQLKPGMTVMDIGAGDGRILQAAVESCADITAIGYECLPSVYCYGYLRLWWHRPSVQLRYGNAFKHDLSQADVVFTYLFPAVMKKLQPKFEKELKKGAVVVSHAFQLPDRDVDRVVEVSDGRKMKKIFIYQY